ncbi:tol-pal system-associated acyl-CoA thioesterase [Eleftheria terrae]|uniref:tol-pal system-associated acyl-CoA thioesterase n=1 Tax=Eleftheria terrae TaxID=1597781 RepID=UPI00263B4480|nr:tol-pal system-associated acyl-CoA thioesterase [Eleftheria terrae]WKB52408.1 tol-pal system-associated acyl-CoA thioesterase [Eleftheria terrae]
MPDATPAAPAPFSFPVRVYWEDTDAGGVVFYANYLKFFERARTEWLRARGFEQQRLRQEAGLMFVVVQTAVRYLQPARLDDRLDISVEVRHAAQASLQFVQRALRQGTIVAEGDIKIGCVDAHSFRPRRIPAELLQETTT